MLCLTRNKGQSLVVDVSGERVTIRFGRVKGTRVTIAIEASAEVNLVRGELLENENVNASGQNENVNGCHGQHDENENVNSGSGNENVNGIAAWRKTKTSTVGATAKVKTKTSTPTPDLSSWQH